MKLSILAILLGLFTFAGCNKDEDTDKATRDQVENALEDGTWKISFFELNGSNETSTFDVFNFDFKSTGELTVTGGPVSPLTGGWAISDSDPLTDDVEDLKLSILFEGIIGDLGQTSRVWDLTSFKDNEVKLRIVENENSTYLTFTKQ